MRNFLIAMLATGFLILALTGYYYQTVLVTPDYTAKTGKIITDGLRIYGAVDESSTILSNNSAVSNITLLEVKILAQADVDTVAAMYPPLHKLLFHYYLRNALTDCNNSYSTAATIGTADSIAQWGKDCATGLAELHRQD